MGLTADQVAAFNVARSLLFVGRGSLFENLLASLPNAESEQIATDDLIPQFGFVGEEYSRRRILILGINPGNGGRKDRSASDAAMMPSLHKFAAERTEDAYKESMRVQMAAFSEWNSSRQLWPLLSSLDVKLAEIAYTNANPYRAGNGEARDVFPNKKQITRAGLNWVTPLLSALRPHLVLAHGKSAAKVVQTIKYEGKLLVFDRNRNKVRSSIANAGLGEDIKLALENPRFPSNS